MMKQAIKLGLTATLALAVGCTTSSSKVQKYAAVGAVGGGIVGAWGGDVIGHGLNTVESGLIGATAGGLVGALVGDAQDQRKMSQDVSDKLAEKDKAAADAQEKARAAETKLAAANSDLAAANRKIEGLNKQVADLTAELANCKGSRVEITLTADVLFNSGSATLSSGGMKALDEAATKISKDQFVMVEGHTDTDPIKASSWKSNWELGAARSLAVLHYLSDKGGVDPAKMGASTYSQYQPVGSDKAKNRRAVIVLYTGWPSKKF